MLIKAWSLRMSRIVQPIRTKTVVIIVSILILWITWKVIVTSSTFTFNVQSDLRLPVLLLNSSSPNNQMSQNVRSISVSSVRYRSSTGVSKQLKETTINTQMKNSILRAVSFKVQQSSEILNELIDVNASPNMKEPTYSSRNNNPDHSGRGAGSKLNPGSRHLPQLIKFSEDALGNYLNSRRFDVIIKLVYAYYYTKYKIVPEIFAHAYKEHERVWGQFTERCTNTPPHWFDAKLPCKDKNGERDFISSFHKIIDTIKEHGFQSNMSRIPTDKNGVILNGAHRLAATVVLSKNATFEHFDTLLKYNWNNLYFEELGMQRNISELVMLEWMKLQLKFPQIVNKVFILSLFSDSHDKDIRAKEIVSRECSKDNGILFEKSLSLNKLGMSQLIRHMYGNQTWISKQIQVMLSLFKKPEFTVKFMFFFAEKLNKIRKCKFEIRKLYNYHNFKSSAHIPDSPEESFIQAQMILDTNSVQFLNYGKNGLDCLGIATELANRSSLKPIPTLPGLYIGREDLMIDSGAVMHLFNLRNRTDVDVLFLEDIDKRILGSKHGYNFESHAFSTNNIGPERAWGDYHFSKSVNSRWDLFYDPRNFGFCYGIKFVSIGQLIKYKLTRNEPHKDTHDVNLVRDFQHYLSLQ